jgi:hypothetical protein
MNKYLLIIIIFFHTSGLFAELTKQQQWAIALTGIMTERNRSSRNTLNADEINEQNKAKWLETLRRDWSINNREELLEMLEKMENNGNAATLKYVKQIIINEINENNNFSIIGLYNKYQLTSIHYNYLKFIVLNWPQFNNRTILAWDLGRNISLCRWGYSAGFLSEEESWERIMHYAKKIQLFYNSWEEYGYDYYMGQIFWASGSGSDIYYLIQTDPIYKKLIRGYWNHLAWYTNLGDTNQDLSIRTIYYQAPGDNDGGLQFYTNDSKYYDRYMNYFLNNLNDDKNVYQCRLKKISGHEDYGFGILFCADDSDKTNISYYRLFITAEGRFTVQKRLGGEWTEPLVRWTASSFLKKGYDEYNYVKVVKADTDDSATFTIYFNDSLAVTFEDSTPLNGIRAGLVVSVNTSEKELFPNIPVDVRFDY